MREDCLLHKLKDEEHRHFEEQGYLIVENALSPEAVDRFSGAMDRLHEEDLKAGEANGESWYSFIFRSPKEDNTFLDLLDWHTTFPKVWGILGWNIYAYTAHMDIRPPDQEKEWLEWHQDSARVNVELKTPVGPRLSLKVAYFLSDMSEPGRGNFLIIPGSHLSSGIPSSFSEVGRDPRLIGADGMPDEAIPICVKPGTAVFFDRRMWHSRSPNHSDVTRKAIFYGYGYRWIRPKTVGVTIERLYEHERCDLIRKQLLGAASTENGRYSPKDEDVPLREWLIEQLGEDAVAAMN
jgi:ectoine hydroxylase-related dioxygenase (phytanoyl-CoA dioxygenase family)